MNSVQSGSQAPTYAIVCTIVGVPACRRVMHLRLVGSIVRSMSVPLLVLMCVLRRVFHLSCLRLSLRLPFPELVLGFAPATLRTCQVWVCLLGLRKL